MLVEVLRGTRDQETFDTLKETYQALQQLEMDDGVFERAAEWGRLLSGKGKTVAATDLLIASSAHGLATVAHVDNDFKTIGSACGLKEEMLAL